jgi:hypothetical protein
VIFQVIFMNQFPLSPWLYRIVSFKFFPKFEEMFTNLRVLTGGVGLQIALVSCDFVIFKSTEEWTNRNQKFSQLTNRKQQEYKINVGDMSPINTNIFFPLPHSKWQWRQIVKSLSWEFKANHTWIFSFSSIYLNSTYIVTQSL